MTDYRKIAIGDVVHMPETRGIWRRDWEAAWFIFQVPPRGELPASAWLTRNGVAEVWYPSEQAFKRTKYKPNERIPYTRPIAPGYLFAVLDKQPHWDVLFARSRGKLARVVSHNGEPVAVPDSVIQNMAQVPQRLEAIREAERAKRMIRAGDKVAVNIAGVEWQVEVSRIDAGIAHFVIPLLGGREVQATVDTIRKVL